MIKKKSQLFLGIIVILLNIWIIKYNIPINDDIIFSFDVSSNVEGVYQLYYSNDGLFSEANSLTNSYINVNQVQKLEYKIASDTKYIRIDFPNIKSSIQISKLGFTLNKKEIQLSQDVINNVFDSNSITQYDVIEKKIILNTEENDPHIIYNIEKDNLSKILSDSYQTKNMLYKAVYMFILNMTFIVFLVLYKKIVVITREVFKSRKIILRLAKNDFKTKYIGSYLGITWAFIQPVITILVYWFVFEIGFRTQKIENFPFVLWLITGLIPWFYFSEAWLGGTNSLIEYSYLVKKVVFKKSILPIVKIVSALFVHLFFILFIIILFMINGYLPDIYLIQIIYYVICMIVLLLGLSYLSSAIVVFFRDLSQIIGIFLQVGMWMTPILWNYTLVDKKYQWILKLNPIYYIVNGYRDALINKIWFWQSLDWTIYYWCLVGILFMLGTMIFKRLKPHFADVL